MPRHRGKFDPGNHLPYELSRSRIENFVRCPACFYLQQVCGIRFPSIPGFNINEATDILLKRDFDKYRGGETTHPFLQTQGMDHLIPFQHENFEKWTQSLHFGAEGRFNTVHKETNLKVGGGVDDIWINSQTGQLHIVDYKSTSQKTEGKVITLDDKWKAAYKRQMDMYVWVLKRMGFDVSPTSYFLYCDGDRFGDYQFLKTHNASMEFHITLIPYTADPWWVENTLLKIYEVLRVSTCPEHAEDCEYGGFIHDVSLQSARVSYE